jgi:hypothetical protein
MHLRRFLYFVFACFALGPPLLAQVNQPAGLTASLCTKAISVDGKATVGIQVGPSTWAGTLQAQVQIGNQGWTNVSVTADPTSTTNPSPQATITANGNYSAYVSGKTSFQVCGNTVSSGTATIVLNPVQVSNRSTGGSSGGGTTTNALTLNNGGAGAASGATFNGASAVTLSYNTLGAAPLASPTFTGTVAGSAATFTALTGSTSVTAGIVGTTAGLLNLSGSTSGTATLTAPAVAGTAANPVVSSNNISAPGFAATTAGTGFFALTCGSAPSGTASNETQYCDSVNQPHAMSGTTDLGIVSTKSQTAQITGADWTCGTGGTVSSCATAQTIGTLSFTLPLVAANWSFTCDLIVGQATAATTNSWNVQTATNGATNLTANYLMSTGTTTVKGGAITDVASTTTTQVIAPTWNLGGAATQMPVHLAGTIEGASASGTVLNIQLVAPTVTDLVTIYRGSQCRIF